MTFRGKFLLQRSSDVVRRSGEDYEVVSEVELTARVSDEIDERQGAGAEAPGSQEEDAAAESRQDDQEVAKFEPIGTLGLSPEELAKVDAILKELRDSDAESREARQLDWQGEEVRTRESEEARTPAGSEGIIPEGHGALTVAPGDEKSRIDEYIAEFREKVMAGTLSETLLDDETPSEVQSVDELFNDFFKAEAGRHDHLGFEREADLGTDNEVQLQKEESLQRDEVDSLEADSVPLMDAELETLAEAIRLAEDDAFSSEADKEEGLGVESEVPAVGDRVMTEADSHQPDLPEGQLKEGSETTSVDGELKVPEMEGEPGEEELSLRDIDTQERMIFPSEGSIAPRKDKPEWSSSGPAVMREAQEFVYQSIQLATESRFPSISRGESLVDEMLESIEEGPELLKAAMDRDQAYSVSAHCVNVTILSLRMAATLGCGFRRQRRIGLAALFHEVGVARLPSRLIFKEGGVADLEIRALRNRPQLSAQALQNLGSAYSWMAEAVGQVYEREDGSGSPLGLTGEEIYEEARIIGASDLFEACIHQRPYRKAITGYQALFELTTHQAKTFPDRIVKALIRSFSLYPYNEKVVLNNGEAGRVIEINRDNLSRPVVELLYSASGEPIPGSKVVDLSQKPALHVVKAVTCYPSEVR